MKRMFVFNTLLFFFFLISPAYNQSKTIKVGVYNFQPMLFMDSNKKFHGLFIDLLEIIAKKEDWKIEYIFGTWDECLKRLENKAIDILPAIVENQERAKKFDFTRDFIFLDWALIYTNNNSGIKTIFDLNNKKLGVLKGSFYTRDFKRIADSFGIKPIYVEFGEYTDIFKNIQSGKLAAGINSNVYGRLLENEYRVTRTQILFSAIKVKLAVQKTEAQSLLKTIDYHLKSLKADPNSLYYKSYHKWIQSYVKEHDYPAWVFYVFIGLMTVLVIVFIFTFILKKQIDSKTRELNNRNRELHLLIDSLTRSEARYRDLFEMVGVGLAQIDEKNYTVLTVNNWFSKITGYSKEEICGKNFFEYFEFKYTQDEKHSFLNLTESKEKIVQLEKELKCKNGNIIWINLTLTPHIMTIDGNKCIIAVLEDITEKLEAIERIQLLANFPLENPNPVIQLSCDGEILLYNGAAAALINCLTHENEAHSDFNLKRIISNTLTSGKISQYEYICNTVTYLLIFAPISEFNYVNLYCTDITELKNIQREKEKLIIDLEETLAREKTSTEELEASYEEMSVVQEELESSNIDLERTLKKAETANVLKTEFLANMSHEIRTPLTAILGFNNLMSLDDNLTEQQRENLNLVKRSGERLMNLLMDILLVSQIEVGKVIINKNHVIIEKLTDEIKDIFSLKLKEKKIELLVEFNHIKTIYTDEKRLNQILVNLIGNAIKFTDHGAIQLAISKVKNAYQFSVKDSGIGIKKELIENIFDSFIVGETGYTKSYQGAGLGLTICKRLTKLLGGKIWVESEPNKGSIFYFTIPIENEEYNEKETSIEERIAKSAHSEKILQIAIVDDEEIILDYMKAAIKKISPHRLSYFSSCAAFLESFHNQYDLIFMDIRMPSINGIECLGKLRKFTSNTPVIALTAFSMSEDRDKILSFGFNDYMTKPIDTDQLLTILNRYAELE